MHTADVFRRSFVTDKNNFFAFGSPGFGIFSIKDGTADGSSRRSRQTSGNNFFLGFRIKHRVQQLV